MLGKLGSHLQKNETGVLSYTIHKNLLKMDYGLKCKTWNNKTPRQNIKGKLLDISLGNEFLDVATKAKYTSGTTWLHQTKNHLHSKGHHRQSEKATYEIGDNICNS